MPELITMASYSKKKRKKSEKRISSETSLISPNNPVGQGVMGLSWTELNLLWAPFKDYITWVMEPGWVDSLMLMALIRGASGKEEDKNIETEVTTRAWYEKLR